MAQAAPAQEACSAAGFNVKRLERGNSAKDGVVSDSLGIFSALEVEAYP